MAEPKWKYPVCKKDDALVDEYTEKKIKVADPYRCLEDPDGKETIPFVEAQNAISRPYLDAIPERKTFHARYVIVLSNLAATLVGGIMRVTC